MRKILVFSYVLLFLMALCFVQAVVKSAWFTVGLAVVVLGVAWYRAYGERRVNSQVRKNLLGLSPENEMEAAFQYIICHGEGSKDEFVRKFGVEMYERFLAMGYIRENHVSAGNEKQQ